METSEASPASEMSPAAFVKTEEENSKISGRNYLRWSGRVRINARPSNRGLGTVQIKSIQSDLGWPF